MVLSNFPKKKFFFSGSPYLVEDGALPKEPRTVAARVRLLVRVDPRVLGQVTLLPKPFPTVDAWVRSRLYVDAAMLQQRTLLLELLLADGTAHEQWHARYTAGVRHIGEGRLLLGAVAECWVLGSGI